MRPRPSTSIRPPFLASWRLSLHRWEASSEVRSCKARTPASGVTGERFRPCPLLVSEDSVSGALADALPWSLARRKGLPLAGSQKAPPPGPGRARPVLGSRGPPHRGAQSGLLARVCLRPPRKRPAPLISAPGRGAGGSRWGREGGGWREEAHQLVLRQSPAQRLCKYPNPSDGAPPPQPVTTATRPRQRLPIEF